MSILPNFQTFSEFAPSSTGEVSHGDCGWLALLAALHVYDPQRYPLTGDALAALRDDAIALGYADSNGAVNIPRLDAYCAARDIPHRTYCSYAGPLADHPAFAGPYSLDDLHALLKTFATNLHSPVIVETSTAGAGLPEDERGVYYHYFTVGGISLPDAGLRAGDGELGGYWRADGDAVNYNAAQTPKDPILTSFAEVGATNPVGYLLIDGAPKAPGSGTVTWIAEKAPDGSVTGAHDENGAHCGAGDALLVLAHYQGTKSLVGKGEAFYDPGHSVLALDNDVLILASNDGKGNWTVVDVPHGGQAMAAMWQLNAVAYAQLQSYKQLVQQLQSSAMSVRQACEIVTNAICKIPGVS